MTDFTRIASMGYGPALLPIIPPGVTVSAHSKHPDQIAKNLGKIPGRLVSDGWVGMGAWRGYEATPADHARWSAWGAGAGLQTARFPAFDIDVEDQNFVASLLRLIQGEIGFIFGRVGRAPRVLIPCRAADGFCPSKLRLPLPAIGEGAALELLGDGQQFVLDGVHPKTGNPYSWGRRGFPEADRLPVLDAERCDRIFAAAADMAGVEPLTRGAASRRSTEVQHVAAAPNFDAVREALKSIPCESLSYDDWIKSGVAVKALSGDAGFDIWREWSLNYPENTDDLIAAKWATFNPPFHAGWDTLRAMVPKTSDFNAGTYEFTEAAKVLEPLDRLFDEWIWIENLKRAYHRGTRVLLDDVQFAIRNNDIAPPRTANNAFARWVANPALLKRAVSVTYRPGQSEIVREKDGDCVNTWSPSGFTPATGDIDADAWLAHMAYILPDEVERETLFDWLAFVVQQPGEKPNFQVVWGSTHHGVGKSLALEPARVALGERNVRSIQSDQVVGTYTDWYENARLIVIEEMKSYGKRELENRLRPYMAAPPHYVSITKKYLNTFDVPNIAALIFLTNEENAVPISKEDRRYFVLWSDAEPRDAEYYERFAAWGEAGGNAAVASWLLARDISKFNAKARAPMTAAKLEMQGATLSPLEAWIEDGIANGDAPFDVDIVEIGDILKRVPQQFKWDSGTHRRLAQYMKKAGAVKHDRVRLGKTLPSTASDRGVLWTVRRPEMYASVDILDLVNLFWQQREKAVATMPETANLSGDFDACEHRPRQLL